MRRERHADIWQKVAITVVTEATLVEQPKGGESEYRIIVVKKSVESELSNTAMVAL